jgi:plasmid stabilization system protein ParE
MRVVWSPRAKRDLHELISYIAEDSVQAAEAIAGRILKAAKLLSQFPKSGRMGASLKPVSGLSSKLLISLFIGLSPAGFAFSGSITDRAGGQSNFDLLRQRMRSL